MSLDHVIQLLLLYKYWLLFPIAFLEGPIITVLAGFLSSLGEMNFIVAFVVVVLADLSCDSLYYYIGRSGRTGIIMKYGKYIGATPERIKQMEVRFKDQTGKILLFGKWSHGIGTPILFAAGISKVKYSKFLFYNFVGTMVKSGVFIVIGYYFGSNYKKIDSYLNTATIDIFIGAVVLVILYLLYRKFVRNRV